MLSFTIAHASVIQMRRKPPPVEEPYRVWPSVRVRGVDWPLFAVIGGFGTAVAWLVVVVQDAPTRYAGLTWLGVGFVAYAIYRRRIGTPLSATVRAPILLGPAIALEYRSILVPVVAGPESREAIDLAARLAGERGATIVALRVIVVPMDLPLEADLSGQMAEADRLLDEARDAASVYGVRMIERVTRARRAGSAIVDEAERRQAEIIVLGAPRGRHRKIFGHTVDYVLKNSQCRVMVAAGKKAA
jgi:APA family basic amino acid/polyamine antiporter